MTLYLTEETDPADVAAAAADGLVTAVKLYPAGATTNSASGVRSIRKVMPVLERMAAIGLPLCVHGEVTDAGGRHLRPRGGLPRPRAGAAPRRAAASCRIVLEHVTTADGVHFVEDAAQHGRDADRPPPDPEPQPPARGRHPAALLLPAGGQAREAPPGAVARRDRRRPALLPRHRQRAARAGRQGGRLRLRRGLLRAGGARLPRAGLRGRGRARPARGLRQPERPRLLPPAAERGAASRWSAPPEPVDAAGRASRPAPGRWWSSTRASRSTGASSTERSLPCSPTASRPTPRWRG